jgi:hypothetical protein
MDGMIDRDEIVRGLLRAGVEPPAWLDEFLAENEKGPPDPLVFLPSPQGLVPVLFWTDGLNNAVARAVKESEDYQLVELDNARERNVPDGRLP